MKKLIACLEKNGKCVLVLKCRNVEETQYTKMINQQCEYEQEQLKEKRVLNEKIIALEENIELLKKEIKLLKGEEDE